MCSKRKWYYFTNLRAKTISSNYSRNFSHPWYAPEQRGMVFLFLCDHIPKCRWSKRIGRKEVILRFIFFPRDLGWKKKTWQKKGHYQTQIVCIFSNFGSDTKFRWRFFFSPPRSRRKKNRKIGFQWGREEIVSDTQEKKTTPLS